MTTRKHSEGALIVEKLEDMKVHSILAAVSYLHRSALATQYVHRFVAGCCWVVADRRIRENHAWAAQ